MKIEEEQGLLTKFKEAHFTMVALGDSNTEQNHWTGAGLNWLGMVSVNIRSVCRNGYTIINSGVSGDTAAGALGRIDRDVLRFAPDQVIIAFGLNDSCLDPSPESFIKNLDALVKKMQSAGSDVLLRTPNPIIDMSTGHELHQVESRTYHVKAYADATVKYATENQLPVVDHYAAWTRSMKSIYAGELMLLMGNTMHPNSCGHRRFYHELAPALGLDDSLPYEFNHLIDREHL